MNAEYTTKRGPMAIGIYDPEGRHIASTAYGLEPQEAERIAAIIAAALAANANRGLYMDADGRPVDAKGNPA